MSQLTISRRSVIAGGFAAATVGCGPSATWDGSGGDGGTALPVWLQDPGLILTVASFALPGVGHLFGRLGVAVAARWAHRAGAWADTADSIYTAISSISQLRNALAAVPAADAQPRAVLTAATAETNSFEHVPVFDGSIGLYLGILDEPGANFGSYDVWATIKNVADAPPRSLTEALGNGDLPHAVVTPATDGSFDRTLGIGTLPPGAYVSYTWRVPTGQQPTDEFIQSQAMIGPVFLSMSQPSFDDEVAANIESGLNVEAQFRLPSSQYL